MIIGLFGSVVNKIVIYLIERMGERNEGSEAEFSLSIIGS